ncbi:MULTISPECIES: aromatic-ring-hydroxylating dioxygenase subunit beta [unclassified Mycobacterium]|uniref:aromatic-ring-hydroxylating dioxygenase subunit beta n=1 Tax=unclassified Mycobacterium TaxID=2642494 RepID=UPI0029C627E9|nr:MULTISPECIES: aromatic-ring-hydroxylating dioxygenase subunit beta [unclassified Mycobacterium]
MTTTSAPVGTANALRRIITEPAYLEVVAFLVDEAELLNDDQQLDWLQLLTEDFTYQMPSRSTVFSRDGAGFDDRTSHYNDDRMTLELRVQRNVAIQFAYDRDPPPRTRRIVGNVVVFEREPDVYDVTSGILLVWNRFDTSTSDVLSARREDVIRRTDAGLRLASRRVLIDQSRLDTKYTNIFL